MMHLLSSTETQLYSEFLDCEKFNKITRRKKPSGARTPATCTSGLAMFGGEDTQQQAALLPSEERPQVMRTNSASTLARRSARPRSLVSTLRRSRSSAAVGDATDSVSDWERADAMATEHQQPNKRRLDDTQHRIIH